MVFSNVPTFYRARFISHKRFNTFSQKIQHFLTQDGGMIMIERFTRAGDEGTLWNALQAADPLHSGIGDEAKPTSAKRGRGNKM